MVKFATRYISDLHLIKMPPMSINAISDVVFIISTGSDSGLRKSLFAKAINGNGKQLIIFLLHLGLLLWCEVEVRRVIINEPQNILEGAFQILKIQKPGIFQKIIFEWKIVESIVDDF